jgi:nitrite reductase/ring-hydroxylating ferredoxin subunit
MNHAQRNQGVRRESSANACARHTQFARGLRVCVDTRRHEDVRKARASDTGQLHGSRGRCPRAREVRDRVPNVTAALCLSVVCPAHGASFAALEPRGGHVPRGDARCGAPARRVRVFSRARSLAGPTRSSRDPHDANHPASRQVSLFVRLCTRARGRHATASGAFLNFDTGAAVRCASNVRFFLILTGPSRDKTSRSPA